jgi:predicted amidophosphoribosyltransferase
VRNALIRLKFAGLRSTAAAVAPWMVWALARSPPAVTADPESIAVTWVPLGVARRRARGYDQAEALARAVGKLTGRSVQRMLNRVIETTPQARRSGSARRLALRGAFTATGPVPPAVLLVDDVLTSGATAASCAEALRRAGAREVVALSAARSLGGPVPARCYNPPVSQPGSVVARERFSR